MIPKFVIDLKLLPPDKTYVGTGEDAHLQRIPIVCGWTDSCNVQPSATTIDDAEENAVRLAEQMVRQLFRKFRERGEDYRPYSRRTTPLPSLKECPTQ